MNLLCEYFGFMLYNYCITAESISDQARIQRDQIVQQSASTFTTQYEWNFINYTWPSYSSYIHAIVKARYVPENNAMAGIKIYKGNLYIALPRIRTGTPVTLASISIKSSPRKNPLLKPYPNWIMNVGANCSTLQSVQSMEIDSRGIMWVIDGMRINNNTKCPSKLVLFDLNNNGRILRSYKFPKHITPRLGGFLNDIVIDETDGGYAYITDHSDQDPGLVIYSKLKNRAWKIRDSTMFAELNASNFIVDGLAVKNPAPIDGIALSPLPKSSRQERFVYFCALAGVNLYYISTKILKDEELCQKAIWRKEVKLVGAKQSQSDGMMMDNVGNLYYTLLPLYDVGKWNIKTPFETSKTILDQNKENIVWPDSLAFSSDGYLYLLANNINKFFDLDYDIKITTNVLFRVLKIYTGTKSYLVP